MNYYLYRAYLLDTIKAARTANLTDLAKAAQCDLAKLRKRHNQK